jgi:hypothetical protein
LFDSKDFFYDLCNDFIPLLLNPTLFKTGAAMPGIPFLSSFATGAGGLNPFLTGVVVVSDFFGSSFLGSVFFGTSTFTSGFLTTFVIT